VQGKTGDTTVEISVNLLLCGLTTFSCANGSHYILSANERLEALNLVKENRDKVKNSESIRTLEGWRQSLYESFCDYADIGDEVNKDIITEFMNVLPPRSLSAAYLQMGEAYSHEFNELGNLRPTYMTFQKKDGRWYYIGMCFGGDTENKVNYRTDIDRAIARIEREQVA
jgi:hypothetical protein